MWTLLVVREALRGVTRFGDFQRNTGIAKNLLADRLSKMVADGCWSVATLVCAGGATSTG